MRFCNPARRKPDPLSPNFLRKAAADENGVTAIEFALVLGPFLALLFGIISVGFYFFSMFSLEHAIETASRQIRIGAPPSAVQFKTDVCAKLPGFMDCNNIRLNVQNSSNYVVSAAACLDNNRALIAAGAYTPGAVSDVIIVTVCFEWNLGGLLNMVNWIAPSGARMGTDSLLLTASTVFTREP